MILKFINKKILVKTKFCMDLVQIENFIIRQNS